MFCQNQLQFTSSLNVFSFFIYKKFPQSVPIYYCYLKNTMQILRCRNGIEKLG